MTRQNDQNAFPKWFQQVLWFAGIIATAVIYHQMTYSDLKTEVKVLQSEVVELKNKFGELKNKYGEDVNKILIKTDEIVKKLDDKK